MTQPIPQHAVDAALDEWFKQNLPNWRESVAVWTDPWREGMARAISAALTAMGASVVVWRGPEEFVPSERGEAYREIMLIDRKGNKHTQWAAIPLVGFAVAWAELPTSPPWAEADQDPVISAKTTILAGGALRRIDPVDAPDDLVSRVDALEQDGAHDHAEVMKQGARIAELEARPEWTKEKENLLHRLTTEAELTTARAEIETLMNGREHMAYLLEAARAEIERLKSDAQIMAHFILGHTPDLNTQTPREVAETEVVIEDVVKRALNAIVERKELG